MLMHGADRDIIWLQRDFGIYICNLFDMGQVLATSTKKSDDNGSLESEKTHNNDSFGEDDEVEPVSRERESRVRTSCLIGRKGQRDEGQVVFLLAGRDKLLPFVFRCLSRLPNAVGKEQTHFDILQARKGKMIHGVQTLGDWYSGATRKTTKCRMGERLQMIEGIT
ncbi:protein SWEETIE isoform X5 [Cryptomeria japonica]|uniref:protein SWEETIE isoform X5 n=1 Tax=Cryptomeria japonica TaxID=3369 RepID=UPI0027D9FA22|nr:protein SWEETIE isoform X5 [Cryptomeria japonica]